MATGKSRGAQSMLELFFTELEASCFDYVLYGHRRVSFRTISINFEFESHSTAYTVFSIRGGYRRHRVETYRDVTSVPTFIVRMLVKLLDACI
jgi:hypothetical protein